MKRIVFSFVACLAVAGSALAGHEMKETKEVKQVIEPCFKDTELQLDIFAVGSFFNDNRLNNAYEDGAGGGIGINYFFMRYLGVGVDGDVENSPGNGGRRHHVAVSHVTGKLIARYPIELGGLCLAPYAFVGGGGQFDGVDTGTWTVGGGLEWRAVAQKFGIFAEGKYEWSGNQYDSTQARLGVRVIF